MKPPESPLDRTDRAILALLLENARLTNKEIASRVGVAQSTCSERLRRLEETGVLRGYHAELDFAALGIGLHAMIAVRLRRHERTQVDRLRKYCAAFPEVVGFFQMAGQTDFLVQVVVRNSDHLRDLAMEAFTSQAEVARIETSIIFEHTRFWRLPDEEKP